MGLAGMRRAGDYAQADIETCEHSAVSGLFTSEFRFQMDRPSKSRSQAQIFRVNLSSTFDF